MGLLSISISVAAVCVALNQFLDVCTGWILDERKGWETINQSHTTDFGTFGAALCVERNFAMCL